MSRRQHFAAMCEKEGWTETVPKLIHVTPKELVPKQGTYVRNPHVCMHVLMFKRTYVFKICSTCVRVSDCQIYLLAFLLILYFPFFFYFLECSAT